MSGQLDGKCPIALETDDRASQSLDVICPLQEYAISSMLDQLAGSGFPRCDNGDASCKRLEDDEAKGFVAGRVGKAIHGGVEVGHVVSES